MGGDYAFLAIDLPLFVREVGGLIPCTRKRLDLRTETLKC
jgi:hypothetical protein